MSLVSVDELVTRTLCGLASGRELWVFLGVSSPWGAVL